MYSITKCYLFSITFTLIIVISNSELSRHKRSIYEIIPDGFNYFFIYPGTLWCGANNISSNPYDLGLNYKLDSCCRDHDNCPDYMHAFQEDHGLYNSAPYSRLHCDCDKRFLDCLKSVQDVHSTLVGFLYFSVLRTQCYEDTVPKTCLHYSFFPYPKCLEYGIALSDGISRYQWFDVPNYFNDLLDLLIQLMRILIKKIITGFTQSRINSLQI